MQVVVIRNYVPQTFVFGGITLTPFNFVEVPIDRFEALPEEDLEELRRLKEMRSLSVQMAGVSTNELVDGESAPAVTEIKQEQGPEQGSESQTE